jgi:hypothetical protein
VGHLHSEEIIWYSLVSTERCAEKYLFLVQRQKCFHPEVKETKPQSGPSGVPTSRAKPYKAERSTRISGIFEVVEKVLMKM